MFAVLVEFRLNEGAPQAFLPLMRQQAMASRAEAGCLRFDVCLDPDDPARIMLYEIYDDRAAFDLHLGSDHFRAFDRAVAAMVARKAVSLWSLERDDG